MAKTPTPTHPILLVDDEGAWLHGFSLTLATAGLNHLLLCDDARQVLAIMARQTVAAVILDLNMPHLRGDELLPLLGQEYPEVPIIVISGLDQVELAVNCMKLGAFDYFTKVSDENRLLNGVRRALELGQLRREHASLKELVFHDRLDHPEAFQRLLTRNKKMRSLFQYMEAIASSSEPVLITGETGVGKELIAAALHTLGGRPGNFVPVNIAGLEETSFADTLFGHKRGAFTGAAEARTGLIGQAANGTLFLDEIGDLNSSAQVKLLRLIQEREYLPLGSDIAKHTDARMIFATHRPLLALQQSGEFRKDLFFRLRTHHLHIPPLRDRLDDLPLLLEHFLANSAAQLARKKPAYAKEIVALLATYSFPGNVRELQGMIFDAVSRHQGKILGLESFREYLRQPPPTREEPSRELPPPSPFAHFPALPTLKEAGAMLVREALARAQGNQAIAAGLLGITRQALNWRLRQTQEETEEVQD